jgi:hypothetical protein
MFCHGDQGAQHPAAAENGRRIDVDRRSVKPRSRL